MCTFQDENDFLRLTCLKKKKKKKAIVRRLSRLQMTGLRVAMVDVD